MLNKNSLAVKSMGPIRVAIVMYKQPKSLILGKAKKILYLNDIQ